MVTFRGPLEWDTATSLVNIPSVPIDQLYKHMVSSNGPNTPSTDESIDDTASLWTLFSHTGIYVMAMGLLIPAGLGRYSVVTFSGADLPD